MLAAALGLTYAVTLAPGLSWAHSGADGGDLIAATVSGGVAHPTGYPLYLLLARLWLAGPMGGEPATKTNIFSAVCAILAAELVAILVAKAYPGKRWAGRVGGWLAGFAFGLSPLLWAQAVITEVYSLNACLVAGCWLALPVWTSQPPSLKRLAITGVVLGAALGNHLTAIFMVPPAIAAVWTSLAAQPTQRWRGLLVMGAGLGITAGAFYGLLPLWASRGPAINWGNAATLSGWLWVVTAEPYRGLAFGALASGGDRLVAALGAWVAQFGAWGVLIGLVAFGLVSHRSGVLRWGLVWLFVTSLIFAAGYNTADSYNYLIPAFLAFTIELGRGLAYILERLQGYHPGLTPLALALMTGLLFWNAVPAMAFADASRDSAAESFIAKVAQAAPNGAILVTSDDRDSFAMWYMREALSQRRDVAIIVKRLWTFEWYRQELIQQYPDLNLPATDDHNWEADLRALNRRPVCLTLLDQSESLQCLTP